MADIPVDAAVGPIGGAGHVSVLDRIPMNAIQVMDKIPFVADAMFPKSALPNGLFIFALATGENGGPLFGGNTAVNDRLILRQRMEKSALPGGNVHTAWM